MTVSCVYSNADSTYHEFIAWKTSNDTGIALSIDNPGVVGSYGQYGPSGSQEIPSLGCYAGNGPQTYTIFTVGGTGPRAQRTITRTGTYTPVSSTTTSKR
jgi:hypothetical protein